MATDVGGAPTEPPPRGRDEIVAAALDAAERLFARDVPRDVSMRDIAAEARVTYSLVNRHLGTKDDLLDLLLTRFEQRWQARTHAHTTLAEAAQLLLGDRPEAGAYNRLLALSLLGRATDAAADSHRRHALLHELVPRAEALGLDRDTAEARVATLLAVIFGWRFFAPFIVDALHLEPAEAARLHEAIGVVTREMASAPGDPPT